MVNQRDIYICLYFLILMAVDGRFIFLLNSLFYCSRKGQRNNPRSAFDFRPIAPLYTPDTKAATMAANNDSLSQN